MAIKRKDFQKLADAVNEFQKKLTEGTQCAELRDSLNLTLFLMQKHYRFLQLKMRDKSKQKNDYALNSAQPGQFVNNIKVSDDNKFEWTWVSSDSPRMIESLPLAKRGLQTPVPFIVQAAKDGDLNMIRQLIEKDPNCVNDCDGYGRTALFYCIHYGQINTMAVLLQCGANPEISCNEGSLPLHIACFYGNAAAADLLLHSHQPDSINYQDNYGRSAVHWAVISTTTDCLRLLVRYGANLSLRDRQGLSPAMWACRMDRLQHLQLLLQAGLSTSEPDGIERDEQGLTWLHWAVIGGTECFVALMDDTTVQLRDKTGRTAFLFAAEKGCIEALKVMRERIPKERLFDVDNFGRSALHLATVNGQGRIVGFLLDCGLSTDLCDTDSQTPIDLAKGRQLNYCIRVFAAHISASAQPNYRHSAKTIGNIQGFSPFGTLADTSPSPGMTAEKAPLPPRKMRPPLSETPQFVPRPPHPPNRSNDPRLIQSTDQMDASPITTLQPTPPPPDARRNARINRQRLANNRLSREGNQAIHIGTVPTMQNDSQMAVDEPEPSQEQILYQPEYHPYENDVIEQSQEQVVPMQPGFHGYRSSPVSRGNEYHGPPLEQQMSVEQYNTLEHMQPADQDGDVTVGVAPLTAEALAYQQRVLQHQYVKQLSREGSLENPARQREAILRHQASVQDENGDDNMSTRSIHAEKDDETSSSHDSTADTVVISPTKTAAEAHRHRHRPHNPPPPIFENTPRTFLASAKQHASRDDINGDEPTPPPSKIPILSSSPVAAHSFAQNQLNSLAQPGYLMQPPKAVSADFGIPNQNLQQQQQLQQQQLHQQQQQQFNQQMPQPQQQVPGMPNHPPLPPPWVHLPPVQASRSLPPPPNLDDYSPEAMPPPRKHGGKTRKNKAKRANHNHQSLITPLQPVFHAQPIAPSPPPPHTSPAAQILSSGLPINHSFESVQPSPHHQVRQRLGSASRTVETERIDVMESEMTENQAVAGYDTSTSPQMQRGHRPPSRRGAGNEEQERAMFANQNRNMGGTPTMLSRRSRQNAPVLSPSPTGNASPQLRPQENHRNNSPVNNSPPYEPIPRNKSSDTLPSAFPPQTGRSHARQPSPAMSPSLTSSPIPALAPRPAKSAGNSDSEQPASRPASGERPGSPPPSMTYLSNNRRRGRIELY